jgi:hypothetical protein
VKGKGQARNRLTGIRTRGSPATGCGRAGYIGHRCVGFKAVGLRLAPLDYPLL